MKRFFAYIFLTILLLNLGGFYAILRIQQEEIREEVEQKIIYSLPEKDLICIVGTKQNLSKIEWERAEKEFWFEGNLFDVIKTETRKGITSYYCFSDKAEEKLMAQIDEITQNQNKNSSQNNTKILLKAIFQIFTISAFENPHFLNNSFQINQIFASISFSFSSDFLAKNLRPPQFFM